MNRFDGGIRTDPEYAFPQISGKFIQGYPASYLWLGAYLDFRDVRADASAAECRARLESRGQPVGRVPDAFRGALLGSAVGDALGTTNEFKEPGSFEPLTDMVGGGPFGLRAGDWTDDTSMAYALGQSLLLRGGFDAADQLDKYLAWYRLGCFSSTGSCFDIGNTVRAALERFEASGDSAAGGTDEMSAGNGSLMRLAPVPLYYYSSAADAIRYAGMSSETTHRHPEAISACRYFSGLIWGAVRGASKKELLESFEPYDACWTEYPLTDSVARIATGAYASKTRSSLNPTGYVLDTIQCALWCFANSDRFEKGALLAANLGGDADTIAAVYGQIAGAFYGEPAIPAAWLRKLRRREIFFIQAHQMLVHAGLAEARYAAEQPGFGRREDRSGS